MIETSLLSLLRRLGRKVLLWLASWWKTALFGVMVLTLALSPSSYHRAGRSGIAAQIVRATTVNLAWFAVLSALISVVVIRIVVVTAFSYGLSRFAIEMVVRVLVLELIPLAAAMFVAVRYALPDAAEVEQLRMQQSHRALGDQGLALIRQEFLPRVLASVFAVWMLGAVSCVMTLVLAYVQIYGFTPWALAGYTRVVGQVFNPAVTLILVLKIFFFSLAISFIPMASAYYAPPAMAQQRRAGLVTGLVTGLAGMVRLFAVVLAIEMLSLMGNYY